MRYEGFKDIDPSRFQGWKQSHPSYLLVRIEYKFMTAYFEYAMTHSIHLQTLALKILMETNTWFC